MPVTVHTLPPWKNDKVANAERLLVELRLKLAAEVGSVERTAIEHCIRTVEAMLPVYQAFERFMASVEEARAKPR